jgi:hypothetical protein
VNAATTLESGTGEAYHRKLSISFAWSPTSRENNMRTFLLSLMAITLLGGCPDNKAPKKPPSIPEPKAVESPARQSLLPGRLQQD